MELTEQSDYLFCSHCKEHVSRSTYRRHQLMTVKRKREVSSSSDSDAPNNDASESSRTSSDDSLDPPISSSGFLSSVNNGK